MFNKHNNNASVSAHINELIQVMQKYLSDAALNESLQAVCDLCLLIYRDGIKILIADIGCSTADAHHFAGELISCFYLDRGAPLYAIAHTSDTSILTAIGNDYVYKDIFSRQILANGYSNDLFIAFSTSGKSENILEAIELSRKKNMLVVGLIGAGGVRMKELCNHYLVVPSFSTHRIQECHLVLEHTICAYIEQQIFGGVNH